MAAALAQLALGEPSQLAEPSVGASSRELHATNLVHGNWAPERFEDDWRDHDEPFQKI